jgi:hypothetical protein
VDAERSVIEHAFSPANPRAAAAPLRLPERGAAVAIAPVFVKPSAPIVAPPAIPQSALPPPPMAVPDVTGIGRWFFNCDLANNANLPPEQRANCLNFGIAPPAAGTVEAGMPKTTKAKHSTEWAAELAARQTPPEVPCTSLQQQVFGGPGVQKPVTTLMADPLCLLNGLLNGFHAAPK